MKQEHTDTYDDILNAIGKMRKLKEQRILNESEEEVHPTGDGIPYTSNDEILTSIVQACKTNFGADFSRNKNPMVYYTNGHDAVVSGSIPTLGNATFKFSFNGTHGKGCELTGNQVALTEDELQLIGRIYGTYKNWKTELLNQDIRPITLRNGDDDDESGENGEEENNNMTPGDDLD